MEFQVPQFIEVEDKLFGPLTLKQFIYLAGGGGVVLIIYLFVHPLFLSILLMTPFIGLSVALAFYKVNGKPFIFVLEAAFMYLVHSKLYLWRKEDNTAPAPNVAVGAEDESQAFIPKLSQSRLKEMTWSLDTKQGLNPTTHGDKTE